MDITTLAAWGEFLGGIAVVVSLIYLASQIRQNSRLVRASSASTYAQNLASFNTLVVQDPETARIYLEGGADRESLSEIDRRRFDSLMTLMLAGHNQHYEFDRDGLSPADSGHQMDFAMRFLFEQLGARQWWRESGRLFLEGFRSHAEEVIREGEAGE